MIGEMAYRGVVLPELTTIRRSTLDKLVDLRKPEERSSFAAIIPVSSTANLLPNSSFVSRPTRFVCRWRDWGICSRKSCPRRSGSKGRVAIRSGPICAGYGTE